MDKDKTKIDMTFKKDDKNYHLDTVYAEFKQDFTNATGVYLILAKSLFVKVPRQKTVKGSFRSSSHFSLRVKLPPVCTSLTTQK